jgi:ABC-type transporter Mla maintaining outer membrane lipid asymmetry permease subunit MlaE
LQRDGLFTLGGALLALAWIAVLGAIGGGLILGAGFAVDLVREHTPWLADWIGLSPQ